jgi:hypothetical protein
MATKAQIARKVYKTSLNNLSAGQKAQVTKLFNKQDNTSVSSKTGSISVGQVEITFTRSGGRSATAFVDIGTTYEEALDKVKSFKFNPDKEGLQNMQGDVVRLSDEVKTGTIIVSPNVDSAY